MIYMYVYVHMCTVYTICMYLFTHLINEGRCSYARRNAHLQSKQIHQGFSIREIQSCVSLLRLDLSLARGIIDDDAAAAAASALDHTSWPSVGQSMN